MFVTLGGKLLKVAGKFAKSIACCCGYDTDDLTLWKCLLSSDGSYRCDTQYDIEQDQLLSEHSSKEDCERFCGQDQVYCYYDDKIGYYCTDYFDEGYLSGPYPDTITCNEACRTMWFCVDKGSGGGETQYECTLQDPVEDYLSGPYGSKEACEYRCGPSYYCVYKYINTDEYEYECVRSETGEPDNTVSGPYRSDAECEAYCQVCKELILPEQKPCPDCVDDACRYMAGDGGLDGGEWGTCCAGLIETWRYCDGDWELIIPCSPEGKRTAGTPACEVYPESLDFPEDPVEGQLYTVECDRVLGFDPSSYPDCEDCDYSCIETDGAYNCELDPAGPHKTLQGCLDRCPEKWSCITTDECVQKPDGKYETESECVEAAPVDCAATGACCFPDGDIPAHCHEDAPLNQEGPCVEAGGTFYANETCLSACPSTPPGICLYRADGLGSCYRWYDGRTGNCDYESAEAAEEGAANDAASYTNGAWWYVYPNNPDDISEGWCYELFYRDPGYTEPQLDGVVTEGNCVADTLGPIAPGAEKNGQALSQEDVQAAFNDLISATWVNDQPATDCKTVNRETECNESTGVFCPNVTECPEDLTAGCPDPNRSISFAPPP